jgi:hypothetical protein
MRAVLRRILVGFAQAAVIGALAGCLSPTLPLPPPTEPEAMEPGEADGTWIVSGDCTPGATVTLLNDATGRGVVFEDRQSQGTYRIEITAMRCDQGSIREQIGEELSPPTSFFYEETAGGVPTGASACR